MPLGKRSDYGDSRYAGVVVPFAHDMGAAMQDSLMCGFDFVVAPLVDPSFQAPPLDSGDGPVARPRLRGELMLTPATLGVQIVGTTSAWIDADAAGDPDLARRSQAALRQQLQWAAFLGLQAVVLQVPRQGQNTYNFAQVVRESIEGLSTMALWVQLPMAPNCAQPPSAASTEAPAANGVADGAGDDGGGSVHDPWSFWWQLFSLCEYSSLLGVIVEVPLVLPPQPLIARWLGQPLKAVQLPTSCFTTNKRGYPVLPRPHQDLLTLMYKHGVQVVLSGEPRHRVAPTPVAAPPQPPAAAPGTQQQRPPQQQHQQDPALPFALVDPGESHPLRPYWEYLAYLFRRLEDLSPHELAEAGYRDHLQAPLQPLQDNLESQTYEVFEKDDTKYDTYGAAVEAALRERVPDPATAPPRTTVLMVVGAGRGPLVRASLKASERCGRPLRVYAVEKNPSAVVHIQALVAREGWEDRVTIVHCDMRTWEAPEPADILVSELLGSFGDNELSPECLDGAQRFLAPDGISIPSSYTSFLAPITSAKLHDSVRAYKDTEHWETPYVVKLHRAYVLSPPQPVFTFVHPTPQPANNERSAHLTFPRSRADGAGVLHGFAGYFEAVLYGDVTLSTHPPTHTRNMFSWFPLFFPLRQVLPLAAGAPVVAHMWRRVGPHKVWYEWAVSAPQASAIHNPAGRSYYVGL